MGDDGETPEEPTEEVESAEPPEDAESAARGNDGEADPDAPDVDVDSIRTPDGEPLVPGRSRPAPDLEDDVDVSGLESDDEVGEEAIESEIGAVPDREADDAIDALEQADVDYAAVEGPQEDEEMPLAAHIEEMLKRLAVVVAVAGIVSLITFPLAERIINFLWYSILPGVPSEIARPRLYGILELKFTELKVASLGGLIVALPVLVYQTYQFMRPGLYPHERRYYLAAIPTSLVLALIGVSFAYFIVLPVIFTYFLYYSQDVANIGFALGKTFNLILVLMGYLALVFQIPLFILLAMMMGLVTRRWLADRRLLFWGSFLGLSFIFSPDPTGMAPIIVALTMIGLFEGTLLLTKWTDRGA